MSSNKIGEFVNDVAEYSNKVVLYFLAASAGLLRDG
jgi:hypothetical protein